MTSVAIHQMFFIVGNIQYLPTKDNMVAKRHINHRERALSLVENRAIARVGDFKAAGIPHVRENIWRQLRVFECSLSSAIYNICRQKIT
ncbi:MAG: hypothetical protein FWD68_00805 [Alphaproteobacteria bacterium]|nr:hypothetical protein [Alphaproteobacteria bacterium]